MKFVADFHIHSSFSRATGKDLSPETLALWGVYKGIKVIGAGDFTHPGWTKELLKKLELAEPGLFRLKKKYRVGIRKFSPDREPRFILTSEISNIYKYKDKTRKVHNLVLAPSFEVVEKIQKELAAREFNITSDGRPILGLDSRDLLELFLEIDEDIFFIPAHIWTPWFSALGSKSGFDSIKEAYRDLSKHIYAVETGLSSDPPMNWLCSFLDDYTLISNSDAHSAEKLGREANFFNTDLNYDSIINAVKKGKEPKFLGTIEFFSQEGKYHFDGHRKCGISWSPLETIKHKGICPKCGKKVTVGVMNRVAQLADRENIEQKKNRANFYSLIPLKEILSEIKGVGPGSKTVDKAYHEVLKNLGSEFDVLLNLPVGQIQGKAGEVLAEAIKRMRNREVYIHPGFDGEYGRIKLFHEKELEVLSEKSKTALFTDFNKNSLTKPPRARLVDFDFSHYQSLRKGKKKDSEFPKGEIQSKAKTKEVPWLADLNQNQRKAVEHFAGPALVLAGPGTGKTRVLTTRIAYLIKQKQISPASILALTFTNKAVEEMKNRLEKLLSVQKIKNLTVSTFHAFGYEGLKKYVSKFGRTSKFSIIDQEERKEILAKIWPDLSKKEIDLKEKNIGKAKVQGQKRDEDLLKYDDYLKKLNAFDLEDLIYQPLCLFKKDEKSLTQYQKKFKYILVDEYQDVNQAQYDFLKFLLGKNLNFFAIGDPDQAIYGFRGASKKFIDQFLKDYPKAQVFELDQSYRCSTNILAASSQVLDKESLEGLKKGVKIKIVSNQTERSEAEFLAREIEKLIGGVGFFSLDSQVSAGDEEKEIKSLSEIAILCRVKFQMPAIKKALINHNLPFQAFDSERLFEKSSIKKVIKILKFVFSENKINQPELLSSEILAKLQKQIQEKQSLDELVKTAVQDEKIKDQEKDKLLQISQRFGSNYEEFLKFVLLGRGPDLYDQKFEAVSVMTLHAAKGLEFKAVFIPGCEKGILPYTLFKNQSRDLEEEKRLFYVGMTRAQIFLYLTWAGKRLFYGKMRRSEQSPFVARIKKDLLSQTSMESKHRSVKQTLF